MTLSDRDCYVILKHPVISILKSWTIIQLVLVLSSAFEDGGIDLNSVLGYHPRCRGRRMEQPIACAERNRREIRGL